MNRDEHKFEMFMTLKYGPISEERESYKEALSEPWRAFYYASNIIKAPWPEAESIILTDGVVAALYSARILNRRWLEAEEIIKNDSHYWDMYTDYFGL